MLLYDAMNKVIHPSRKLAFFTVYHGSYYVEDDDGLKFSRTQQRVCISTSWPEIFFFTVM